MAAIAAVHDQAPSYTHTDWDERSSTWAAELGSVAHDLLVHVLGTADGPRVQYAVREFATQLALIAFGLPMA